ncbi:glycosyltransferase family 2 protein [Shimia sp. R9_3]|uniref:glycosyltransferase family 2 protein n=1 Tax=Shimia sp. R9_3 TaxID=2821113 RepID=UPI001ADB8D95|nr:glycosyltransferase family 2 protein [Shimia sp. R9_3]MBO9403188.1 glycosyltransferase family 2 protein [Shimia sp. R9_3]
MTAPKDIPSVSVIIPAWNAAETLSRAVTSALNQEGVSVEVIVVDDASTDETLVCAERLAAADNRVRVLRQKNNQGPAAARNLALDEARAPYVTPLDSDDFMEKGRLRALLAIAQETHWDFVADDLFKVPESDIDGPRQRLISDEPINELSIDFAGFVQGNLSSERGGRRELGFIKPLISKTFLEQANLRYDESLRLGEDYILYASALLSGARFCLTDPCGYVAVMRPTSLSGQHSTRDLGALVQGDLLLMANPALKPKDRTALKAHYIEALKKWHWLRLIDAVKSRSPIEAMRCFYAPFPVIEELLRNLREQFIIRCSAKCRSLFGRAAKVGSPGAKGGKS